MTETTSGLVVPDLLSLRVAQSPDNTVMNVNGETSLTYAEWDRRTNAMARGLLDRGVQPQQVVALFFGGLHWIEYVLAYLAVLKAGATAMHLNDTMPAAEVERRLRQCGATGVIRGSAQTFPAREGRWVLTVADLEGPDDAPVDVGLTPEHISDILYSSGTTSQPKAVRVPHGNLTFGQGPQGFRQLGDPRPLVTPMQVGTTASVTTTSIALTLRATLVVSPPGDVERMAELIAQYAIGSVMINPMVGARMVATRIHQRHDLRSVHTLGTAAAPMPPPIADRLLEMFPNARMRGAYTEISAVPGVIVTTYDPARPLVVGRPTTNTEVQVVDEHGDRVPDGELGEIRIRFRGPRRRLLDPSLEAPGGWTRTQDLGRVDEDGTLRLFDRVSDAVRIDGYLVSTIEVEAVVHRHPAVREAAVMGVPGPDGAPELALAVVLDDGPDALGDLQRFLAARLEPHRTPTRYLALPALPFLPNGKVRKVELRQRFRELAHR
ncbi:MAG TPA: class I adenylate-forming enzyme family protein [Kineosporiaceae bacterium]